MNKGKNRMSGYCRVGLLAVVAAAFMVASFAIPKSTQAFVGKTPSCYTATGCHSAPGGGGTANPQIFTSIDTTPGDATRVAAASTSVSVDPGTTFEVDWYFTDMVYRYSGGGKTFSGVGVEIRLPSGWPAPTQGNTNTAATAWGATWDTFWDQSDGIAAWQVVGTDTATFPASPDSYTLNFNGTGWDIGARDVAFDNGSAGDLDGTANIMGTDAVITVPAGATPGATYFITVAGIGHDDGGSKAKIDQVITVNINGAGNTAPAVPTNPGQFESDGSTAISVGGFSSTTTLVFDGDLTDPDGDTVKLQIDYNGDNTSDCESVLVASGSTNVQATCAGLVDGTGYDWQYRAMDVNNAPSAWTAFNAATPDFTVDATAPTLTSTNPVDTATDVPLDQNVTITFNEANLDCSTVNATNITSVMPGWTFSSCSDVTGVAVFTSSGQANSTGYSFTITSNVADKAGNTYAGPTTISYTTIAAGNTPPNAPINPAQYESDGTTAIAVGGFSSTTTLVFEGDLSDPDGDTVKLQIDYTGDNASDCESGLVASGSTNVQVSCAGLTDGNSYDWQYQAVDSNAAASGWTAFNGASPDFTVDATAPTLTSTNPANGATGVTVDQNVTITFNEANLDCGTVNTTNITSAMPGWAFSSCNDVTGVAVFTTSGQTDSTPYSFTVTSNVADKAGNAYAGPTTINYTTAGPVCVNASPTLTIDTANQQITADGGTAVYTISILNNDNAPCGDTSFDLVINDTNGTDFQASTFASDPIIVSPGATGNTTITVTHQTGQQNGSTNDSYFTIVDDTLHGTPTSNTVTTLVNIAGTPTMHYNVGDTVHIEFRTSTRFFNNGLNAVSILDSSGGVVLAGTNMVEVQDGGQWIYTYDWDSTAQPADSYQVQVNGGASTVALATIVLSNATAQLNLFLDPEYLNPTNVFADGDTVYVEVILPSPETAITTDDVSNFYGAAGWNPTNNITQTGTNFRFDFVIDFVAASVADGDWGWFYWQGTDTGIEFHEPIKRSDLGCGTCTPDIPNLTIVTAGQSITTDGGSANYTINLTNNDSVACGATAFDLVAVDSNVTEFLATGSTFVTDPLNVAPGATGSTTMTVTAQGGFYSGSNTSSFTIVDDTIHGTPSSGNVITTLAVPDATPPAVAITAPTNGSYLNAASANPFTITGTASDDRGVTLVEVSIDGGAFTSVTGTGPWTYSWTLPADGSHTIDARATDGTNTTNATQVTVTVDTVAPVSNDNVLAPWSSTDRSNVTLSVVEATSGVSSTVYCVDTANGCAPGTAYGGPFTISQGAGQETVQYLRYFSTDNAGNTESVVSTAVNIDKKSPVDGASLTATPGNDQVSLSWDPATDGGSGLDTTAAYRIWRQSGPTAPACGGGTEIGTGFTATSHVDLTAANGTEYSYRVCAYDLVGNPPSTGLTATATPAAACGRVTPSVAVSANQDITSDGGFVDYTITVTNNDTGGCAAQTFDIKTVTDTAGGFTLSYPNGTTTGSIAVGANDTSLVARVTANGGTLNGATHTVGVSTDQSTDVNHNTDSTEAQATTTMNVTCTAPTVSIDETNKTIAANGGSITYNVSVDWSGGPVACGVRNFALVAADTNAVDFIGTTFTADPLSVTPGAAAATTTMIVDSNANVPDLSTNDTYFYTALNSNATQGDVPQSANSAQTVTTTVDRTCVRNAPSFGYGANRTIDVAGSAVYTLTVINNDVDCLDTTFDITLGTETDTGAPSFTTPSVLSTATITVAADNDGAGLGTGGSDTLTLTVTGNGAGFAGDTLTSDVTLSDATNHSGQDVLIQPVTTIQPNNPLIHNSISTESTKWGSSWGISGGKYGKFECATCHSADPADLFNGTDENIKRVRATITTPDGSNWASTGTTTVSVRFTDANPSPTGIGFGDDSDGHTTSTRVCEACHTQNKYHNYDTSLNTLNTHENNNDCTSCHKHNEGFKGGGNCATCHDYPPDPASGNAELATEGEGAHPKHVSHLVTLLGTGALDPDVDAYGDVKTIAVCGACHDMSGGQHETSGGTRGIDFSGDPGTAVDDNQYRFAPSGSPTYNGVQGTPSATTPKSCSNVSCHYQETPVWE